MKRFVSHFLFSSIILSCLFSCDNKKARANSNKITSSNSYRRKNFDSLLNIVNKNASTGLDTYKALLLDSAFTEIFEHSTFYFEDVTKFLSNGNVSKSDGFICAFAMQNLNIYDYLKLCRIYKELYDNRKISDYTMERLIGGFLDIHIIEDNRDNIEVATWLKAVHIDPKSSNELKRFMEDVFTQSYFE